MKASKQTSNGNITEVVKMDKLKCPCVNWYPESFMSGTRKMTNEEVGIYIRALNNQFIEGGIEPDEYKSFPARVKKKFIKKGDVYINERMEYEHNRKKKYKASREQNLKYHGMTQAEWEALPIEERMKYVSDM